MIKPTLLYCSTVWISCSKENIKHVFKLQKRAAHVILDTDTRANSVQLFKQLEWIPFLHKRLYRNCPDYFTQLLLKYMDINSRTTRHGSINLVCPRFKRETEPLISQYWYINDFIGTVQTILHNCYYKIWA